MNQVKDIVIKGGNFVATISGTILDSKVEELLSDAISFNGERGGWSKVFKGVKDRKTVAFSADAAVNVANKLDEALKGYFVEGAVDIKVKAREWSEGAGGAQAKAQLAYDEMLALGMPVENALRVAKAVHAGFVPTAKVEEVKLPEAATSEEVPTEV